MPSGRAAEFDLICPKVREDDGRLWHLLYLRHSLIHCQAGLGSFPDWGLPCLMSTAEQFSAYVAGVQHHRGGAGDTLFLWLWQWLLYTASSSGNELNLVLHLRVFGPDRALYLLPASLDFESQIMPVPTHGLCFHRLTCFCSQHVPDLLGFKRLSDPTLDCFRRSVWC